jgi:hypothetical protein
VSLIALLLDCSSLLLLCSYEGTYSFGTRTTNGQ